MTEAAKLIVIAATFFFLMIGSWAAILEVLPHFGTDYILDAKFLWNTVASMRMLPGTKHALSEGLGVAERFRWETVPVDAVYVARYEVFRRRLSIRFHTSARFIHKDPSVHAKFEVSGCCDCEGVDRNRGIKSA
ncbi:uncharacterized protein UBRO_20039 [Ustilago bromivora]|uniref:Uncharacterized protein n=1 Tax=Ustilago bromivora TaxID=307758 RepID=A0A1K0G372_9BASI|nr:uncharacterized protein UBRO_20039 [Ustilago bromivora]